jgi:hypothetical protein
MTDEDIRMGCLGGLVVGVITTVVICGTISRLNFPISARLYQEAGKPSILRIEQRAGYIDFYENPTKPNNYVPVQEYADIISKQVTNSANNEQGGLVTKVEEEK